MTAKTLFGLEDILAKELISLGADDVQIGRRIVSFSGDKRLLYKANFQCRTALRILKPILEFKAKNPDEVYEMVKSINWLELLPEKKTFAVDAVVNSLVFTHSKFLSYRVKDAIVDYFTEKDLPRPSVRVNNPDIQIHIHISHYDCTIALDSSGESLHKRGYRTEETQAPLNEVLAAGMILKTGWNGESNFVDPMCGSGTLLIEAALIALNIAPGVFRKRYAFEKWDDFDAELFESITSEDSEEREFEFKCYGSDISQKTLQAANINIKNAGLSKYIDLKVQDLKDIRENPGKGIMVTNPPYGERLNPKDLDELYTSIGERLKHVFIGYDVWIISSYIEGFDKIGLRPSSRTKLLNGDLDCEYRHYQIFAGKQRDFKSGKQKDFKSGKQVDSKREKRKEFFSDNKKDSDPDKKREFRTDKRKEFDPDKKKEFKSDKRKEFDSDKSKRFGSDRKKESKDDKRKEFRSDKKKDFKSNKERDFRSDKKRDFKKDSDKKYSKKGDNKQTKPRSK